METEQTAPVTDAPVTEPVVTPEAQEPETIESLKAKLAEADRKAQNKTEEAERHYKKLSKFEEEEKKRQEAAMSDLEKAQKKAADLEAENHRLKVDSLKQSVAAKIGLPESLALRLQGETKEEIEADAKEILETLPKKSAPQIDATNPNGGTQRTETDAERRKRLNI
jgi:hypothetical protein